MIRILCILLLALAIPIGCQREKPDVVLARVGDAVLTEQNVRKHLNDFKSITETELRQYIQRWINEELLYQEACRKGIDKTEDYTEQLELIKRQIAGQQLLEKEIYSDTSTISDSATQNYFENHKEEFPIREDVVKLQIAHFDDRDVAAFFAATLARGVSWDSAVTVVNEDAGKKNFLIKATLPAYYTAHTLFPEELWKVAATLSPNDISFPIKISDRYAIITLLERKRKDDTPTYEVVRNEVRERLNIEKRKYKYSELLDSLRKRYRVEINLNKNQFSINQQ
ncbi:MAG: peptidyl-prolyl cis-trans isomerase [Ignavibacteriales bacterium]|nr:peptidyl-prolyl cis-trans isomerase [Ignavibacteriales bacterium]